MTHKMHVASVLVMDRNTKKLGPIRLAHSLYLERCGEEAYTMYGGFCAL